MPKQFYKLNDFSGGLNVIKDARDIRSNELAQADNVSLRTNGTIGTGNVVSGTDGRITPVDKYCCAGGGLFYFETDRVGTAAARDTGERWTAVLDARTCELFLHGSDTGTTSALADMGTITTVKFSADQLSFGSAHGGTNQLGDKGGIGLDFRNDFEEGNLLRISGCSDVSANNRLTRVSGMTSTGSSLSTTTNWTSESSESGTVEMEKLANGIFFASDDTLRVTDANYSTGLKRKQYGYIKQIHFEDAGVAKDSYDNWFANDCDLSPPTELLIHASSYPTAGTGFHLKVDTPATSSTIIGEFAAKQYQIAGTFIYREGQESKLYIPTSSNVIPIVANDYMDIDVNASPAYDERITGARVYIRPDGTNEPWSLMVDIDLKDGCRTNQDDEYSPWAVGADATEAGVDTLILTSENFETYTILNGFGPDEFSISLSKFGEGYKDVVIANRRLFICNVQMVDENADTFDDATCDYNNDPTIAMDSTTAIKGGMSVSGTGIPTGAYVESVTSATAFELSASTTGGSVTNGTLTFGNIMKRMRDRIMYTPPNKYETFPRSFFIDVVRGDSDEYTALATFGDRLFAFKRQTLYIINIGSPSPSNWFLESTEKRKGVSSRAGVSYSEDGIYWANRYGAFFFDGSSISNLIKGKIHQRTWMERINGTDSKHCQVAFHQKSNSLYVVAVNISFDASNENGGAYVFNFDSLGWAWVDQDYVGGEDKVYSNFIEDGFGGIVYNQMGAVTGTSTTQASIDETSTGSNMGSNLIVIKTKDIDFGDPSKIKKVYGVRITYKASASNTTPISYAIDGIGNFSGGGGGTFTGNFSNTSTWDVLRAYPTSPVECQSMQIQIKNPGAGTIDINDMSVEYRTIHRAVT
jgi:hypothetical protein